MNAADGDPSSCSSCKCDSSDHPPSRADEGRPRRGSFGDVGSAGGGDGGSRAGEVERERESAGIAKRDASARSWAARMMTVCLSFARILVMSSNLDSQSAVQPGRRTAAHRVYIIQTWRARHQDVIRGV